MKIRKIWDNLQSSLWFRPVLWVLLLGTLAFLLMIVDRNMGATRQSLLDSPLSWFLLSGADGARAMLSAVATAVLTVTTLAFSIMMVAVVQTANAYSPRLLPQYLRDSSNQHVLGILIGTFIYSLLVLRAIHATDVVGDGAAFVPPLATNFGVVLALLSTGAFIYFINHAAHSISVSNIVLLTMHQTEKLIDRDKVFPEDTGIAWTAAQPPQMPDGPGACMKASSGGYIDLFDTNAILNQASNRDLVIRLERSVGDYVLPGMSLATIWPQDALDEDLERQLSAAINLSKERSLVQDVLYGVSQLSDVAVRSLSPGINDPSTAVHCIDALSLLGHKFLEHGPVSPFRCHEEGTLRLIVHGPTFESFMETAFTEIRRYAAGDRQTTLRLLEVYGNLGAQASRKNERLALWRHAVELLETAAEYMKVASDRQVINEAFRRTAAVLGQDPTPWLLDIEEAHAEGII